MVYNENVKNTAFAPDKTRAELLSEAFELLLKLSPEQISKIMEGLNG